MGIRDRIIASTERIVKSECQAAGSPKEPTFEYYDQFPLTDNDADSNEAVTAAFVDYFNEGVVQPASPPPPRRTSARFRTLSEFPTCTG